jgi:regulator of cell morphogenesis and NO signaling
MFELNSKTIREIALEKPQTTRVFEEFKIDYCCGGRRPFAEACLEAGVDPRLVADKLAAVLTNEANDYPEKKTPSDLIDYIVDKHHVFTRNELERLTALMEKVCRKHGAHQPELFELQSILAALNDDLTVHMRKEEMVLFPYIKTLENSFARNLSVLPPHFRTVQNPVRMMLEEHDAAGDFLRRMREKSGDYQVPPEACPSFKALYSGLEDLERDLHRHIHLENNVLFPQAIELEVKCFADAEPAAGAAVAAHECCLSAK